MSNNGTTHDTQTKLRETRLQARLVEETLRLKQLQTHEKRINLQESWGFDVGGYVELMRIRAEENFGFAPVGRQQGRNFPVFQTEQELALIRTPARVLCSTNGYAIGLLEGLTSYVIGNGFEFRAVAKDKAIAAAAQDVVDCFLRYNSWKGDEQPGLEEELFQRRCVDGEFFLRRHMNSDGTVDLRTVEPEQVRQPGKTTDSDKDFNWSFGIKTDKLDVQKHLGYWVAWDEAGEGEEVDADDMTHMRSNVPRSVKRGLSDFSFDTYDALATAAGLRANMGEAAREQASIVGVRQHESGRKADIEGFASAMQDTTRLANPKSGRREPAQKYSRARWEDINKGLNYVPGPGATNGSTHLAILQALARAACVRWNAPEWLGSADSSNNNYASSLTVNAQFVRTIARKQQPFAAVFGREVEIGVEHWIKCNGLPVRRVDGNGAVTIVMMTWEQVKPLLSIQVEPPSAEYQDRLAQAQQFAIERQSGVLSPQTWSQKIGLDPDQEQTNFDLWNERNGSAAGGNPLPMPPLPKGVQESFFTDLPMREGFDESKHPRDKNGHFVSTADMEAAKSDPKKAAAIRATLAPDEQAKFDKAIGGPPAGKAKMTPQEKTAAMRKQLADLQASNAQKLADIETSKANIAAMTGQLQSVQAHAAKQDEFVQAAKQHLAGVDKAAKEIDRLANVVQTGTPDQAAEAMRKVGKVADKLQAMQPPVAPEKFKEGNQ